jgi:hypothetical protein
VPAAEGDRTLGELDVVDVRRRVRDEQRTGAVGRLVGDDRVVGGEGCSTRVLLRVEVVCAALYVDRFSSPKAAAARLCTHRLPSPPWIVGRSVGPPR